MSVVFQQGIWQIIGAERNDIPRDIIHAFNGIFLMSAALRIWLKVKPAGVISDPANAKQGFCDNNRRGYHTCIITVTNIKRSVNSNRKQAGIQMSLSDLRMAAIY